LDTWRLDRIFIRKLSNDRWNFIANSRVQATQRAKERQDLGPDARKDFFYYLLKAKDPETGLGLDIKELWQESNVLMVAGSDTTSTELSAVIFYLLKEPRCMAIVKNQVRAAFTNVEEIVSGPRLNDLIYLKASIDEAMRLAPAVPGAMPREVMEGGAVVDGIFLPGGVDCGTPCYSVQRHEKYYPQPGSFIPERWIDSAAWPSGTTVTTPEMLDKARSAFCPFSIGPRGCIGKSMALMELKLTIARTLFLYDLEKVGQRGEDENGHFAMVDHFTSQKEGPLVNVTKRST
jgi:cytochrome P450